MEPHSEDRRASPRRQLRTGDHERPTHLHVDVGRGPWSPRTPLLWRFVRNYRWGWSRCLRLLQAEWVEVHAQSGPLGLAVYHDTPCDLRIVQEFLLDPALDVVSAGRVADLLLQTVERRSTRCGASGLLVTVRDGHRLAPFERRGYAVVSQDGGVVWLQKALLIARPVGGRAHPRAMRH